MMWFNFFPRKPRCVECGTEVGLHQVTEGQHVIHVCSPCAVVTGYVDFLPSVARVIIEESKEAVQ